MSSVALTRDQLSELRIRNNRIKREKELRRNIILFIISVIFIVSFIFIITSNKSVASDGNESTLYKYYTSVEVKAGDTLLSIANEYKPDSVSCDKYIEEVCFINNLKSADNIRTGSVLVVPYYDIYRE